MKVRAIVYGKEDCSLCNNRKENLRKFPRTFQKKTGEKLDLELIYHDLDTVDGLVAFCKESRSIADIPVVILEDESGKTLRVWHGPKDVLSSRHMRELLISE